MINIIVGENTVDKTAYLISLIKTGKELTNLESLYKYEDVPYNELRLDGLITRHICDVDTSNPYFLNLIEPDRPLTFEFVKLASLMCKEGDILLLNEPDKELSWYEICYFVSLLLVVADSFKEIYITTNSCELTGTGFAERANYMTVKRCENGIIPCNITEEQVIELLSVI